MEKIHLYDKIISPLLTEKSTNLSEQNKVVFKVPSGANTNVISYSTIASAGNATDFGDLTVTRRLVASCSNVHGGLGD